MASWHMRWAKLAITRILMERVVMNAHTAPVVGVNMTTG